jgi:class 3 adenylate cyclase
MPLYVDRHDAPGVTTAEVARMHLRDLEVGPRYGANFLTYWWDADRGSGFCLVNAPDAGSVVKAHAEAHGAIPGRVIEADEGAVRQFLGRINDPPAAGPITETAFRTILFTDLEGSTTMTQQLGDAGAMEVLRRHNQVVREALSAHRGSEVKHTGDGIMASFTEACDAVAAALEMQRRFHAMEPVSGFALKVRIGMSAGEPVTEDGDLFGATVQLALRLCDYGEPGHIYVAAVVRDLCDGNGTTFESRGEVTLKGFDGPVPAFEVLLSG